MHHHLQSTQSARAIAGLLYDGILSSTDWYDGLQAFKDAVGCMNFHTLTIDMGQGTVLESVTNHVDHKAVVEYEQYFSHIDERYPIVMQLGQGQLMLDHDHFSERHMSRSAVYMDCLAPHGMKYTMGVMLRAEAGVHEYLGFLRAKDRPRFSNEERDFARSLIPDAIRAAQLRARARPLARQAELGLAALDALPQGIVIVNAQCHVQHHNRAAERLLAAASAMRLRNGRLLCSEAGMQARWQAIVTAACGVHGMGRAGALQLTPRSPGLRVTVLPLQARHPLSLQQLPLALAVLHDPGSPAGLEARLVGDMLGLSPTETRLALLLLAGLSIKDFALREGMSWHTARSHLKNLMRKTGCHRQIELAVLLQSLRLG